MNALLDSDKVYWTTRFYSITFINLQYLRGGKKLSWKEKSKKVNLKSDADHIIAQPGFHRSNCKVAKRWKKTIVQFIALRLSTYCLKKLSNKRVKIAQFFLFFSEEKQCKYFYIILNTASSLECAPCVLLRQKKTLI